MNRTYQKNKRYENNPPKNTDGILPGLEPEILPKYYPCESYDEMTYHKREFYQRRGGDGIKAAWLYDRLSGSRIKGGHNRHIPEGRNVKFYYRGEILRNFELFLMHKCNDSCMYCGVKMNYGLGYNKFKESHLPRPSLERIDNDMGYTMENTGVACLPCNSTKGDS